MLVKRVLEAATNVHLVRSGKFKLDFLRQRSAACYDALGENSRNGAIQDAEAGR